VLAALVLATSLSGAPAVADGGSCPAGQACLLVTVTGSIQEQLVVTGQDLDDWHDLTAPNLQYRTHSPTGTSDQPRPGQAASIPVLLAHMMPTHVPVGSVTFVTARATPDAGATRLGPADLSDATTPHTGFQDNAVPGFWADTDRQLVRFARPMRSDDDLNYQDVWTTRSGGMATLVVHTTGHIVHPQIQATTPTTIAGTSVGFSATFADGPPPPGPTYAWSFGDGTTSTDASPHHTWAKSGTYSVNLDTGASDGSEGTATPIQVQVGAKPKPKPSSPTKKPGTGTGSKHHTVTGPTKGNGTTTGGTTTGGTTIPGSSSYVLGSTTPVTPGLIGGLTTSTPSTTTPSQATGTGTASLPVGTPVSGILLVSDATASVSTASKAASVPAASARAVPRLEWDRGLLWLLLLPALLVAGGCTQTRWWTRRLPDLPWRTG
jgi:hypothetical protein